MPDWVEIATLDHFVTQHTGHGGMDVTTPNETFSILGPLDVFARRDVSVACRRCNQALIVARQSFIVWGQHSVRWKDIKYGDDDTLLMALDPVMPTAPAASAQPVDRATRLITLEDECLSPTADPTRTS